MDDTKCMVNLAKFYFGFIVEESCGKCTPCRIGTKRIHEILEKITQGKGKLEDLEKLETLAKVVKSASICGLGQTAPNPVLSTMKYFKEEYIEHIENKNCPVGECKALTKITIDTIKCKSCGICAKQCPTSAISGSKETPYVIDQEKCIKCKICIDKCPFKAIS